jgi:hypothetical protein
MEAVRTPEMSVNIYLTIRQYIPEDNFSVFHVRETLKCVAINVRIETVSLRAADPLSKELPDMYNSF